MVTFIEIISGPHQGARYQVRDGLTIGRAKADVVIKDPKVSGVHAEIQRDGKQQFILVDLNSSNGLFIGGRRVRKVALFQDVIFEVGNTQFQVLMLEAAEAAQHEPPLSWKEALRKHLSDLSYPPPVILQTFNPALRLKVIQGVQLDTEWVLGWGPREAGKFSNDICLLEPKLKDHAFKIFLTEDGYVVEATGESVGLNQQSFKTSPLNVDDIISIGDTQIKVSVITEGGL